MLQCFVVQLLCCRLTSIATSILSYSVLFLPFTHLNVLRPSGSFATCIYALLATSVVYEVKNKSCTAMPREAVRRKDRIVRSDTHTTYMPAEVGNYECYCTLIFTMMCLPHCHCTSAAVQAWWS